MSKTSVKENTSMQVSKRAEKKHARNQEIAKKWHVKSKIRVKAHAGTGSTVPERAPLCRNEPLSLAIIDVKLAII